MVSSVWRSPHESLLLPPGEVHVWRAFLAAPPNRLRELKQTLSPDERARADRFRFPTGHDSFVLSRGILRSLLGRYLGCAPESLAFVYGPHGKPELAGERGPTRLAFNLSHSGRVALFALAWDREVGVDVERFRPDFGGEAVARRFFSRAEVAALAALPEEQRLEAFFACWSRKEAYIKARGRGLSLPLCQFDVSLAPGEPARLLATHDDSEECARWSMRALDPGPGYAAAVVAEGGGWDLHCWQWGGPGPEGAAR